jgi:hypothetical protein
LKTVGAILTGLLALNVTGPLLGAEAPTAEGLEVAIKAMRNVRPDTVPEKERAQKAQELTKAWATIVAAGPTGAERLKQELKAIEAAKEKDDFFSLGAATLLWMTGKAKEAEEIGRIWRSADLNVNFNYVYATAFEAAATRDPKVAPMLTALLREKRGKFFVTQHAMNIGWPLTAEFAWGTYGLAGLPALEQVLADSQDPTELQGAMLLLSKAQRQSALPAIRKLAEHKDHDVQIMALKCLGTFGHPDDYELLVGRLHSGDADIVEGAVAALAAFGDLRAGKDLAPLARSENPRLRKAVLSALALDMLCPVSLEALHARASETTDKQEKALCADGADWMLKFVGLDWDAYHGKSAAEKEKLFLDAMKKHVQQEQAAAKAKKFDHEDLLKAAEDWKKHHALAKGDYAWVTPGQLAAAASADDLDLIIEVRARLYERLSDECLDEVETLNNLLRNLGRSRYRTETDLTFKAEKPAPKK